MSDSTQKPKREILVIGAGGVGTMACVALERSGMARVTAVLRSNYEKVVRDGFDIESVDHGKLSGWRPSHVVNKVPDASLQRPFDYVLVTMKNIPETTKIAEIIAPSMTPNHTTIVLLQNGIYIEPPMIDAFPTNAVLSGPSYIGAHERNGHVIHDDSDRYHLGVFHNTQLDHKYEQSILEDFASVYNGDGIEHAMVVRDIVRYRWRKALWNGIYNTMCAITQLDNAAIRRSGGEYSLIRPGMAEMAAIAKADGYDLGENIVDEMVDATPIELSFRPSMLVDVDKGNPVEVEVILGNALRVARREGVQTPILDNTYRFLKLIQNRLLVARGYIDEPRDIPTADFI